MNCKSTVVGDEPTNPCCNEYMIIHLLHTLVSIPIRTEVVTGYAPPRRCLTYFALDLNLTLFQNSSNRIQRLEEGGDTTIHGQSTERMQVV
jgi:hypothetical protein